MLIHLDGGGWNYTTRLYDVPSYCKFPVTPSLHTSDSSTKFGRDIGRCIMSYWMFEMIVVLPSFEEFLNFFRFLNWGLQKKKTKF